MGKQYRTRDATASMPGLTIPKEVSVALAEIAESAKEGLLALAVGAGLQVLETLMEESVTVLAGPKGKHDPDRAAVRHGHERGSVILGGRRVGVQRPRVRAADGSGELPVAAYELFSGTEVLGRLALERMLHGLSTRRYPLGLEPVGSQVAQAASGTSKSAVSRRFVAMTQTALADLLAADLSGLDLVCLMVDGVHFAEHCCVVALGIAIDGTKHPLALVEGSTENATLARELLVGLRERGLDVTRPILFVLDGAKALRRAVLDVFDHPVLARCQQHKIRNVRDKLPQRLGGPVEHRMRVAYRAASALDAEAQLSTLARELDKTHPGAAASLREGLAETLTVLRLGVPPTLARTLRSTNTIESMISICRDHAGNVKRWQDGTMALRWCAAGWLRPPSSSAASTATCTCQPCAPRSKPRSLALSLPHAKVRRCKRPDDHRGRHRSSTELGTSSVEAGRPIAEVAKTLGISDQSIYSWRQQDRIDRALEPGLTSSEKAELAAAKRRIAELETELRAVRRAMELVREVVVPPKGGSRRSG